LASYKRDKKHLKMYDDFLTVAEKVLTETSTGDAPWLIVDGSDSRYSSLTVGQHILNRIQQHITKRVADKLVTAVIESNDVVHVSQQNLLIP